MALAQRIQSDLTTAMKARDTDAVGALRLAITAIKNARVAEGRSGDLDDAETIDLLTRETKKRRESADAFAQAGRDDLADRERRALVVLERYLPEQLGRDELAALVDEAITEVGATGPSDLGKVMSAVMPKVRGRADGRQVNALVRERLSG